MISNALKRVKNYTGKIPKKKPKKNPSIFQGKKVKKVPPPLNISDL